MSLQASKDEFLAINLEKVDPKACFKQLKGVKKAIIAMDDIEVGSGSQIPLWLFGLTY